MEKLSKQDIHRLFNLLNQKLRAGDVQGELYLVGGAVMCLAFNARPSTHDVDAYFEPSKKVREAAAQVAAETNTRADWLNDGVKGYLSDRGQFNDFLELSHLTVWVARADYLLAMKCLAMRIGEEFHDLDDIRYLLRHLNVTDYQEACNIITSYYPLQQFPQKTLFALQELLDP